MDLSAEEWKRLQEILADPPPPTEGLRELLRNVEPVPVATVAENTLQRMHGHAEGMRDAATVLASAGYSDAAEYVSGVADIEEEALEGTDPED